ncbi:43880_t:CDS:2, partial [Gigaspora margarita]
KKIENDLKLIKSNKNKNHKQITLDQALKTSNIEVLSTKTVISNNSKSSKDISLDGHKKKCDKVYSITTSTTHLGEHLNMIHQIFPSKIYEKNLEGQTIIRSDNSTQTIPSMLLKVESHKPTIVNILFNSMNTNIFDDKWPLLEDEILEQSEDSFESAYQENIQNKLSEMIDIVTKNIDTPVQTEMDHFYDREIQTEHLIDDELEC